MSLYFMENIDSEYLPLIYRMDPYDRLIWEVWMPKIRQMLSNWSPKTQVIIYKACFVIVLYMYNVLHCVWIVRGSILTLSNSETLTITIRDLIFERNTFLQNNLNQALTFYCLPLRHFIQEFNEIWYQRKLVIALHCYQILLTFCTKCLIKFILQESVP